MIDAAGPSSEQGGQKMTSWEKSAFMVGAALLTIGLLAGLVPATSAGALVLLVAALTVVLRTTLRPRAQENGPTPGR
jgi:hypothetical protein